jgi:hypothetical protein
MTTVITETHEATETYTDVEFAFGDQYAGILFEAPGTPEEVHAEINRLGMGESTNGVAVCPNERLGSLLLAFDEDDIFEDAGWLAYLRGEETKATRISTMQARLVAAEGVFTEDIQDMVLTYAANSTELEQTVAVAVIDDTAFLRTLAAATQFGSIREALEERLTVGFASKREGMNRLRK